jgi:hypothetical protein
MKLQPIAHSGNTWVERREAARAYAETAFAGKSIVNQSDGSNILIPRSGIDHALAGGDIGDMALGVFYALDEFLQTAQFVKTEPDKKGRNTIKEVRFYDCSVELQGVSAVVRAVVRVAPDARRYYHHFEVKEKALAGQPRKPENQDLI